MDKRFWAIVGVIVIVFAGIMWVSSNKDGGGNGSGSANTTNHVKGNKDAKVKLVEYGDFQCPFCAQFYPAVEQTVEKYKDVMSFQFVHYPLNQAHPNAFAASRAAEAAGNQGKFWEMYKLLFENQQAWSSTSDPRPTFEAYAAQLSLDAAKFKKDFASSEVNSRINADKKAFNKTGMKASTPTFTLNGKQITPAGSLESFSKLIDAELKKQGVEPPTVEKTDDAATEPAAEQ